MLAFLVFHFLRGGGLLRIFFFSLIKSAIAWNAVKTAVCSYNNIHSSSIAHVALEIIFLDAYHAYTMWKIYIRKRKSVIKWSRRIMSEFWDKKSNTLWLDEYYIHLHTYVPVSI